MTEEEKREIMSLDADAALDMMSQKAAATGDQNLAEIIAQARAMPPGDKQEIIRTMMREL